MQVSKFNLWARGGDCTQAWIPGEKTDRGPSERLPTTWKLPVTHFLPVPTGNFLSSAHLTSQWRLIQMITSSIRHWVSRFLRQHIGWVSLINDSFSTDLCVLESLKALSLASNFDIHILRCLILLHGIESHLGADKSQIYGTPVSFWKALASYIQLLTLHLFPLSCLISISNFMYLKENYWFLPNLLPSPSSPIPVSPTAQINILNFSWCLTLMTVDATLREWEIWFCSFLRFVERELWKDKEHD